MAPKNAKRSAQNSKDAPAPKSAKVAKSANDSLLEPVLEAIQQAEHLPGACKHMLLTIAPRCLTTPSDERDEVLARSVAMIGEVIEARRQVMQGLIDEEVAGMGEMEKTKQKLDESVQEAEARLASALEVLEAKKLALTEAETVTSEKQVTLNEKKTTQQEEDAAINAARKEKAEYEAAFNDHFKTLRDQELEYAKAHQHQEAILVYAKAMNLEASLLSSMPNACTKPPSQRGAFDQMVFQELEKEFVDHMKKLDDKIADGAPAAAERAQAVEAADAEFLAASATQRSAAEAAATAEGSRADCEERLASEREALRRHAPEYEQAAKRRDERVAALSQFEKLNVACFTDLRDRVAKVSAEVAPTATAAAQSADALEIAEELVKKVSEEAVQSSAVEVGGA
eukprot:TRINITY_DN74399_c0_g1_i1.p1 TRINITY_DN74399_c0_g1~~TRINITY_DN74399_c0_g1_i1.p1  ORF type:complete len:399 (-),score=124.48 TRINITY_DN74399_c0_g1_i1:83-1279(-)